MFELFVGGNLIQWGYKLSDLTLLLDKNIRDICPYHSWIISTSNNIEIDVSRYDPNCKLITKDIHYFDGKHENIFRICNGLGCKLFSIPEYNYTLDSDKYNEWIDKLKTNSVEDIEIAKFVANTQDISFICSVLENASMEFINEMLPILKSKYTISQTTDGFTITEHSWCLGEPMEINRTIRRQVPIV